MSDNNSNDRIKKLEIYTTLWNCIKLLSCLFFIYSVISFVFWFLNCLDVDWLYRFEKLFIIPYNIVSKYYRPEGLSVDFTLAIIGGVFLIVGFIANSISTYNCELLEDLKFEEEENIRKERMHKRKLAAQKAEKLKNSSRAKSSASKTLPSSDVDPEMIFLIMPVVSKIKKNKSDLDFSFREIEDWQIKINKLILDNLNYTKPVRKAKYRKNLFMVYKNFNSVDELINHLQPTIKSIAAKFKPEGIRVSFCYVFSAIYNDAELESELDSMDTVLSLNFIGEAVATVKFKDVYINRTVRKYILELKGEYNLSKNLTVKNKQPLYTIIPSQIGDSV